MDAPPVYFVKTDDGYDVAYTVSGEGRPFVVTPAHINHTLLDWKGSTGKGPWMEALSSRFRLIHYDSRGQGMSTRGLKPGHSMEDYERDLEAVIEQCGLERFVLFGFLMFSHVAIRYAARHPERVEALVLLNARVDGVADGPLPALAELARTDWEAYLEVFTRTVSTRQDPAVAKARGRESVNQADYLLQSNALTSSSVADVAATLRVPTLLLAADAATWSFGAESSGRVLAALIPDCRLALFDDATAGLNGMDAGIPLNIPVIETFLAELAMHPTTRPPVIMPLSASLSEREIEVLRLIVVGRSSREIGDDLVLSVRTVERHIANIYLKTDTHGRAQVTAYALSRGLSLPPAVASQSLTT